MALTLPPWLDIRPSQFTDAAIAGGQLGQRTAQEAGELAQRGIIAAQEIANRAEQLQVQRESIAAELAGRQAAASQRAAEAQMENAIRQQNFDLEKSAQDEVARRMGERDAAWQEGMSRYERAVNSGDTAAAADAEILQPLRGEAPAKRAPATGSEWSGPLNVGGGEIVQIGPEGAMRTVRPANPPPPEAPPKVARQDEIKYRALLAERARLASSDSAFLSTGKQRLKKLDDDIAALEASFVKSSTSTGTNTPSAMKRFKWSAGKLQPAQ